MLKRRTSALGVALVVSAIATTGCLPEPEPPSGPATVTTTATINETCRFTRPAWPGGPNEEVGRTASPRKLTVTAPVRSEGGRIRTVVVEGPRTVSLPESIEEPVKSIFFGTSHSSPSSYPLESLVATGGSFAAQVVSPNSVLYPGWTPGVSFTPATVTSTFQLFGGERPHPVAVDLLLGSGVVMLETESSRITGICSFDHTEPVFGSIAPA